MRHTVKNFGFSFYLCLIGIYEKMYAKYAKYAKYAPILTRNKI
jgi:hypothetical protein